MWTKSRLGFTIIELLVVIAIVGVLIALLLPAGAIHFFRLTRRSLGWSSQEDRATRPSHLFPANIQEARPYSKKVLQFIDNR